MHLLPPKSPPGLALETKPSRSLRATSTNAASAPHLPEFALPRYRPVNWVTSYLLPKHQEKSEVCTHCSLPSAHAGQCFQLQVKQGVSATAAASQAAAYWNRCVSLLSLSLKKRALAPHSQCSGHKPALMLQLLWVFSFSKVHSGNSLGPNKGKIHFSFSLSSFPAHLRELSGI